VKKSVKIMALFTLVIVGCILATGCIGQIKKNTTANGTPVNSTISFIPFSNATNMSTIPNVTHTPGLNGSLRVSIGALNAILPAYVDNSSIGDVSEVKPLDLMLEEGNHTVEVCCGILCEKENVSIKFGKKEIVDFSEKLHEDCEYFEPTARIDDYSTNGNLVQITVEFINPTAKTQSISAEVTNGYSYIDSRSNKRVGNFVQGHLSVTLMPGERTIKTLSFNLISGSSYLMDIPVISNISIK